MLLVAFAPATAAATPLSELAAELEPGEWAELQTDGLLEAVAAVDGAPATGSKLVYAESAVWHQDTGEVFFVGSDHYHSEDNPGAWMLRYSDQDNAWTTQSVPWWDSGTMHGYDHTTSYGGALYSAPLVRTMGLNRFDPASNSWTQLAAMDFGAYNHYGGLEAFDEVGGLVFVEGGWVHTYDAEADAWTEVASGVTMGGYHNFAEYSPVHELVLFGGGNGSGALHTLDSSLSIVQREDAPFQLRVNYGIVTHDPNSGDFLLFGGDGRFLVYDVVEDQLLEQDVEVPFFDDPSDPVQFTVAAPVASYGVVMFIEQRGIGLDGEAHTWLYRHAPGMGEPPGGGDESGSGGGDETGDDSGDDGNADAGGEADSGSGETTTGDDGGPADGDGDGDGSGGPGGTSGDGGSATDPSGSGCTIGGTPPLALLMLLALVRRRYR